MPPLIFFVSSRARARWRRRLCTHANLKSIHWLHRRIVVAGLAAGLEEQERQNAAAAEGDDNDDDDDGEGRRVFADRAVGALAVLERRDGRARAGLAHGPVSVDHLVTKKSGSIFRVGIFLDFVWRSGTTRTEGPHGGASCVRGARRNRTDPHGGEIERLVPRTPAADMAKYLMSTSAIQ